MIYALWFFMLLTVVVLLVGLLSFIRGGDFYKRNANKMMRLRLLFQAIALVVALILIWTVQSG